MASTIREVAMPGTGRVEWYDPEWARARVNPFAGLGLSKERRGELRREAKFDEIMRDYGKQFGGQIAAAYFGRPGMGEQEMQKLIAGIEAQARLGAAKEGTKAAGITAGAQVEAAENEAAKFLEYIAGRGGGKSITEAGRAGDFNNYPAVDQTPALPGTAPAEAPVVQGPTAPAVQPRGFETGIEPAEELPVSRLLRDLREKRKRYEESGIGRF